MLRPFWRHEPAGTVGRFFVSPLESTLAKVYQNKGLLSSFYNQHLEKTAGGGGPGLEFPFEQTLGSK